MIIVAPAPVDRGPEFAAAAPPAEHLRWTLTCPWLDRSWDLTDLSSPVLKLRDAAGLGQVAPEHWWADAPSLDGSAWSGARTGRGEVFVPLMITGADVPEFMTNHRDFLAALDPRREVTLRIGVPDGSWREAGLRYGAGADQPVTLDPIATRRAKYGITWITADPYWLGPPVEQRYEYETPPPFFPGPPWNYGSGQSLSSAKVTNPGDVESYALWRIEGPFTGFSVGIGSAVVAMTLTKPAGGWVEIDMRPGVKTMLDESGVDAWDFATDAVFEPIPPGTSSLTTSVDGAGVGSAVSLSFRPRYRRAW